MRYKLKITPNTPKNGSGHTQLIMMGKSICQIWVSHVESTSCENVFEPHREKTGFCLCENKGADQLRGNREADQRLCFRYTDSANSLLLKSEISSFYPAHVTVQVGLCRTWSETPKTGFLASRLI